MPSDHEPVFLVLAPGLREFYDDELNLHFVKNRPLRVAQSALRSYTIKRALIDGQLKVHSGEVPVAYKSLRATFKAPKKTQPLCADGVIDACNLQTFTKMDEVKTKAVVPKKSARKKSKKKR